MAATTLQPTRFLPPPSLALSIDQVRRRAKKPITSRLHLMCDIICSSFFSVSLSQRLWKVLDGPLINLLKEERVVSPVGWLSLLGPDLFRIWPSPCASKLVSYRCRGVHLSVSAVPSRYLSLLRILSTALLVFFSSSSPGSVCSSFFPILAFSDAHYVRSPKRSRAHTP